MILFDNVVLVDANSVDSHRADRGGYPAATEVFSDPSKTAKKVYGDVNRNSIHGKRPLRLWV